jgi:hypothetical protein
MDRLIGVHLKVERAKKHIRDLDITIRAFCDSEPYILGVQDEPDISHIAIHVESVEPVPSEVSVIIGDAIHNLRSSLDHLMWQLVEAGGGFPNTDTYFPISENDPEKGAQQYASAIGKGEIKKIPIGAEKVLRSIQPYVTGDSTLWHIHDLDRVDKHRLMLTVTMQTKSWGIDIVGKEFMVPLEIFGRPLVAGKKVYMTPISNDEKRRNQKVKLGLDIAFGQSEVVRGKPVLETLNGMAGLVSQLIPKFEPFLY